MTERLEVTDDQVEELESVLRLVKHAAPFLIGLAILLVVTLGITSYGFVQARNNDEAIKALSREAAANQQQAKDAQRFLSDFLNEENYVCQISGAYAMRAGLPTPKPGQCVVKLPTPRPTPSTPAASPAPLPRTSGAPGAARTAPPSSAPPRAVTTPPDPTAALPPTPTASPLIRLPSLPPLLSLPPSSSTRASAKSARHCGLVDAVIDTLLHGRRC